MTAFRGAFYSTLQEMLRVSNHTLLQDAFPPNNPTNHGARVLRHGLAVSAFSMLERYIENAFEGLVKDVEKCPIGYAGLPDEMKHFLLVDSIMGLTNRLGFIRDPADRISHADMYVAALANYKSTPPTYTAYGFSPKGSNVGHEDVKQAFRIFGIRDAWGKMDQLAAALGGAALSLRNEYKALAEARHRAAHDPVSSIPVADLQSNIRSAIIIGICCDVLARNTGSAIRACSDASNLMASVVSYSRMVRFLDQKVEGGWLERSSADKRAIKLYNDKPSGIAGAVARRGKPFVVIRDASRLPIELAE